MFRLIQLLLAFTGGVVITRLLNRDKSRLNDPDPRSLIITPQVDMEATRTGNGEIYVHWDEPLGEVNIYADVHPDFEPSGDPIISTAMQSAIIDTLDPAQRHFFLLESEHGRFRVAERVLPFAGAPNFRDIGGYSTQDGKRVRWGRVYRAGVLSELTSSDMKLLADMGVKLICDLRTDEELALETDLIPDGATYRHIPIRNESRTNNLERLTAILFLRAKLKTFMRDAYTRVTIDDNPHVIGAVLNAIADEDNLPLIFHCAAGKDRTGVMTALLLTVLGVPEDTIIADYSLSNHYYDTFRAIAERSIGHMNRLGISADSVHALLIADPETLRFTLAYIRERYGTVSRYLHEQADVSYDTQSRLRELLLV